MKKKSFLFGSGFVLAFAMFTLIAQASVTKSSAKIGVINFKTCLEGSKFGKQEQSRFEEMKKQMEGTLEAKEKELNEISSKFSDEYLDTLTPEAEKELKEKFKNLSQEFSQQQNQFYQLLQQINVQIVQKLQDMISKASKKVAEKSNIDFVLNEDACFYFASGNDVSQDVIKELDTAYAQEQEAKKTEKKDVATPTTSAPASSSTSAAPQKK